MSGILRFAAKHGSWQFRDGPADGRLLAPLARWRAEEVAHILGKRRRGSLRGKAVRLLGEPLCWLLGQVVRETDYCKLYEQEING